ncbi:MAG: Holliday junction branch migration protein RuvA, partial [Geminicoccaceae bacterium]|nr:Holliday junction branch migration protein RuvA [Geminicoccaceae bacterium]
SGTAPAPAPAATLALGPEEDALQALLKLGFQRSEAAAALARARARLGEGAGLEALVREGLKELAT